MRCGSVVGHTHIGPWGQKIDPGGGGLGASAIGFGRPVSAWSSEHWASAGRSVKLLAVAVVSLPRHGRARAPHGV